jgi:glycosyltransferase involved in cell wall biosynthesis
MIGNEQPGLVSVVVASYNHAEYLEQRMESLINQTYQNIDILVIDDCSPDNSVEILRQYESHPKVKLVIRAKNGGWVTVSNQGVKMAGGEFVIFANCDDDCDPRMIERLVDTMAVNPTAGIAYCRSLMIDEQSNILGNDFIGRERSFKHRCVSDTLLSGAEMSRFLLISCVIPNLSAALFRRACFDQVGYLSTDYRVCADWELFFRVVHNYDVAYVVELLNKFRQHETTIRSSTKSRVITEEYIRLLLGQANLLNLNFIDRARFRTRVMYLWACHIVAPSWRGLYDIPYHAGVVIQHDAFALLFLPVGLVLRIAQVVVRVISWPLNMSRLFQKR